MTWHYQIKAFDDYDEKFYKMVEVYSDGSYTENGVDPEGATPDQLIRTLEMMLHDAKKYPVFTESQR